MIDKTVKNKALEIEKSPISRQPQNPTPKAIFYPSPSKLEDPNTEIKCTTSPLNPKKAGPVLHPIILQASSRYQVDPNLVKAIIMAESSYNPKAISKKGAMGLMQLMPKTAEALGVEDGFNPEHNIDGGVRYFRQLLNQFNGDIKLALAAYNAGSRKVKEYQGIPPFATTKYYIKKVFEYYQHYKRQTQKENGEA
ncbi:MAG: lytic transglycosylase domain-containing protein [Desulfobacterales bacterium]|nr:lytic transglycosylase domain-containing protein [Desulfobacterales bacterium]